MATVNKDFKVKNGLIVEGSNATVNGYDVLTKDSEDQAYIIGLIGGSATSEATANSVVLRDESASFAANVITAATFAGGRFNIGEAGYIEDDGEILIAAGEDDIRLTADDIRFETADDFRVTAQGDILLSASSIGAGVYVNDIAEGNQVVVESGLDAHIGDATVDGTVGNTVADRIATAKSEAISDANDYTDSAVANAIGEIPTTTDDLTEGSINLYYSNTRVHNALSAGEGLTYDGFGEFDVDLGYGLEISNNKIRIDDSVVATDSDVSTAVGNHSDATTGVHGVTGNVVGTSDSQTLSNKILGNAVSLGANLDADSYTITNLAEPSNASDAATKGYVDALAEGLHVHASVAAATTTNINIAGGYGGAMPLNIDGVSISVGNRILVKNQTNASENGIYFAQDNGSGGFTLVRADDYNTEAEVQAGDFVFVSGGSLYNSTGWVQENSVTTLGTDPIVWGQFSGAGTYSAGFGLDLDGTEFAVDSNVIATISYVDSELDAHVDFSSGVHGVTGNVVGTTDTQTLENKTLGNNTVLAADLDAVNTYTVKNLAEPENNQDAATKGYVDGEITLLSNTVTNLTTDDVAEGDNLYFTNTRADARVLSLLTNATQTNISITESGGALVISAENGVADSDTDDLTEGTTNLYFTNARAEAAMVTPLTAGTQTNISVTYDGLTGTYSFAAENGVADSDTDDLIEGVTNLYFTNARAVAALEAITPNFTEIDINTVATQVAATTGNVETASQVTAYSWPKANYRSAEFLVKVAYSTHTEVSKVLLTMDTSDNIAITEYAIVGTNGSASTITADVSGSDARLRVTTLNNNSTVTVMGTLLA